MRYYFCGWYFKCQSDSQTLAIIPAFHKTNSDCSCSIQLITNTDSWNVVFPYSDFKKDKTSITISQNYFEKNGISLNLSTPKLSALGFLRFGAFTPIRYDIMGPFRYVPFMECRHSVISMKHSVTGELIINDVPYVFHNAAGYIEGDRGRSFPKEYAWTQCSFPNGSLMLSIADIPFCNYNFTGIIGIILLGKKEYRIATYLGAKAVKIKDGEIIIRQGEFLFTVKQLEKSAYPLQAPDSGTMSRTIREHASCKAYYCLQKNNCTLFELESKNASFEYEYPD